MSIRISSSIRSSSGSRSSSTTTSTCRPVANTDRGDPQTVSAAEEIAKGKHSISIRFDVVRPLLLLLLLLLLLEGLCS